MNSFFKVIAKKHLTYFIMGTVHVIYALYWSLYFSVNYWFWSPVHGFGKDYQLLYAVQTQNSWNPSDGRKLTCFGFLKQCRVGDCEYSERSVN